VATNNDDLLRQLIEV